MNARADTCMTLKKEIPRPVLREERLLMIFLKAGYVPSAQLKSNILSRWRISLSPCLFCFDFRSLDMFKKE